MTRRILLAAVLAAGAAIALFAADIDGTWTRETQGKNGPQTQTLTLKANGKQLTGKMSGRGGDIDISEGTVDGNNVAFKVVQDFGGNSVTQSYAGTVSGSELKLTVEGGGGGRGGGKGGGKGPQEAVFTKK